MKGGVVLLGMVGISAHDQCTGVKPVGLFVLVVPFQEVVVAQHLVHNLVVASKDLLGIGVVKVVVGGWG